MRQGRTGNEKKNKACKRRTSIVDSIAVSVARHVEARVVDVVHITARAAGNENPVASVVHVRYEAR